MKLTAIRNAPVYVGAETEQAAFKTLGGPLVLEEVPLRLPGNSGILVKVEACGSCHTDSHAQHNTFGGGFPIVPGHEIIGTVAAVGDDMKGWKVGDHISGGYHGGHDETCDMCSQNWPQMRDNPIANNINRNGECSTVFNALRLAVINPAKPSQSMDSADSVTLPSNMQIAWAIAWLPSRGAPRRKKRRESSALMNISTHLTVTPA
ncbi:chaperonin 10-like protein [Daldinia sp. FL1419]|nr:chaperonin 10-like protein [Daldinia sp. FL1419]